MPCRFRQRRERDDTDDDLPPADGKPLSEILRSVEDRRLGVITEVEFDEGSWEVKIRTDGAKTELDVDPRLGRTKLCVLDQGVRR